MITWENDAIEVQQCIQRKVPIPEQQRLLLGIQGCRLGEESFLGREMEERSSKFRLCITAVNGAQFHSLLPDQPTLCRDGRAGPPVCNQPAGVGSAALSAAGISAIDNPWRWHGRQLGPAGLEYLAKQRRCPPLRLNKPVSASWGPLSVPSSTATLPVRLPKED